MKEKEFDEKVEELRELLKDAVFQREEENVEEGRFSCWFHYGVSTNGNLVVVGEYTDNNADEDDENFTLYGLENARFILENLAKFEEENAGVTHLAEFLLMNKKVQKVYDFLN